MSVSPQTVVGSFDLDPTHSSLQFSVKHMKVSTYRATFEDVDGVLVVDDSGTRLEGRARVESVTIKGTPFREHVVRGSDFLDAGTHPEIGFRSEDLAFDAAGDGSLRASGDLTIRGVTRPISATGTYEQPIEDLHGAARTAISLEAVIDRREWGMDWQAPLPGGGDALAYDVELHADLAFVRHEP